MGRVSTLKRRATSQRAEHFCFGGEEELISQEKTVRFGALFDYPDGRMSIAWARDRFLEGGLGTMCKGFGERQGEFPNVPLALWTDVFPAYKEARGQGTRPTVSAVRSGWRRRHAPLTLALLAWSGQHRLVESPECLPSDPWVWDAALRTLETWYRCVEAKEPIPPQALVRFVPRDYQQFPQPLPESDTVLEFKTPEGEIRREDIDLFFVRSRTAEEDRLVELGASRGLVKRKIRSIERSLRELGFKPSRWKKVTEPPITHFRWLALYQCADFSLRSVAAAAGKDRHNVTLAIRQTAKLIGLTLRERTKGGRPRRKPSDPGGP